MRKKIGLFISMVVFILSLVMLSSQNRVKAAAEPSIVLEDVTTQNNEVRINVYLKNITGQKSCGFFLQYDDIDYSYLAELAPKFEPSSSLETWETRLCTAEVDTVGIFTCGINVNTPSVLPSDGFCGTLVFTIPGDFASRQMVLTPNIGESQIYLSTSSSFAIPASINTITRTISGSGSEASSYNVTFETKYGTAPDVLTNVTSLTTLPSMENVTVDGKTYRFTGWYYSGGTKANANDTITENTTLTARWEEVVESTTPKIYFELNKYENGYFYLDIILDGTIKNINNFTIYFGAKYNDPVYGIYYAYANNDNAIFASEIVLESIAKFDPDFSLSVNSSLDDNASSLKFFNQDTSVTTTLSNLTLGTIKIKLADSIPDGFDNPIKVNFDVEFDTSSTRLDYTTGDDVILKISESTTYTVTFITTYGTTPAAVTNVTKLSELPTLSDVTDGDVIHRFKGWKYENGNTASSGDLITKNTTLTAIWEDENISSTPKIYFELNKYEDGYFYLDIILKGTIKDSSGFSIYFGALLKDENGNYYGLSNSSADYFYSDIVFISNISNITPNTNFILAFNPDGVAGGIIFSNNASTDTLTLENVTLGTLRIKLQATIPNEFNNPIEMNFDPSLGENTIEFTTSSDNLVLKTNGYTLTYSSEYGNAPVSVSGIYNLPELPVIEDIQNNGIWYRFNGWFYENGTQAVYGDTITKNTTLYAHFYELSSKDEVTYSITFVTRYGKTPAIVYNTTKINSLPNFNNSVNSNNKIYYFKGWSYENGEIAKIGDTLSNNVVLTAIWEEDTTKYIITLDPLDGTLSTTTYEGLFGTMIDSEPKPILEGFRFVGWYHNDELVLFPYKITKSITLVAKYEKLASDENLDTDYVLFKAKAENTFSIYLQNANSNILKNGTISFSFNNNAKIRSFSLIDGVSVDIENNELQFSFSSGINNSYIYLGDIVLESLNGASSVALGATLSDDLQTFKVLGFEMNLVINEPYLYFTIENFKNNSMSFTVTAHLANKNKDNVYAIDFILNVPSSVSVATVNSNIFDIYGIDKITNTVSCSFSSSNKGINNADIELCTITFNKKDKEFAGKANISFSNESDANYYYVASSLTEVNVLKYLSLELEFVAIAGDLSNDTSLNITIDDEKIGNLESSTYTYQTHINKPYVKLTAKTNEKSFASLGKAIKSQGGFTTNVNLNSGVDNEIKILVTAEDGTIKEYTIIITRDAITKTSASLELSLHENSKYDVYYNGLIAIDIYLKNYAYDLSSAGITFNFDSSVFKINKCDAQAGFIVNLGASDITFTRSDAINSNNIYIGTVYFEVIGSLNIGNYNFEISTDSVIYSSDNNADTAFSIANTSLEVIAGANPVITSIVIKEAGTNNVLYNINNPEFIDNLFEVSEIAYKYKNIDIYLTTNSGLVIFVNDKEYNGKYLFNFNDEFEGSLSIKIKATETSTTRDYILVLSRNTGDSDNTLKSISVDVAGNNHKLVINKLADNSYEAILNDVSYINRLNVVVSAESNSSLATVRGTGTFNLNVLENIINITVTSENGIVANYKVVINVLDKEKVTIESNNISSLSHIYNAKSISTSDVIITASAYGMKLTSFNTSVVFKNSNDEEVTNPINVGTYKAIIQILASDDYLASDLVEEEFVISAYEVANDDLNVIFKENSFTYTGSSIVDVIDHLEANNKTISNLEYVVKYSNNINVGVANITITANANYIINYETTFTINQKSISDSDITASVLNKEYNASKIILNYNDFTIKYGNLDLTSDDYEIINSDYLEAGIYSVRINGKGNYKDSKTLSFKVLAIEMINSNTTIEIEGEVAGVYSVLYSGKPNTPSIILKINGNIVSSDNYSISYESNTNAGRASVIVKPISGKSLSGDSLSKEFIILGIDIASDKVSIDDIADGSYTYIGNEIKPEVIIHYNNSILESSNYTVAYKDNINAGIATIIISGAGNFSGTREVKFNIAKRLISEALSLDLEYDNVMYKAISYKPQIINLKSSYGVTLSDLNVTYNNNLNAGTANVVITINSDNYSGSIEKTFVIEKCDLSSNFVSVKYDLGTNFKYSGNSITPQYSLILNNGENELTISNDDYSVSYPYGTDFRNIGKKSFLATANADSINFKGSIAIEFEIIAASINEVSLEAVDNQKFIAMEINPDLVLTYNGMKLVLGKDYEINYLDNSNIEVGQATALITGIGNYKDSVQKIIFNIVKNTDAKFRVDVNDGNLIYNGNSLKPTITLYMDDKALDAKYYNVNYPTDLINAGVKEISIVGIGSIEGVNISSSYEIKRRSLTSSDITISYQEQCKYTGKEIHITNLSILYKGNPLTNSDYKITYETENLINVGIKNARITGLNNFIDDLSISYKIISIYLDNPTEEEKSLITIDEISDVSYKGVEIIPTINIYFNGTPLVLNVDYKLTYDSDLINVGTKNIKIVGINNFENYEKTISFNIVQKNINDLDIIFGDVEPIMYTGSVIKPTITIMYGDIRLTVDTDYTVSSEAYEVGDATAVVTGVNNFIGTKEIAFKIIKESNVKATLNSTNYVYTGSEIRPNEFTFKVNEEEVIIDSSKYDLAYSNNINVSYDGDNNIIAGASLTITFKESYEGSIKLYFKIEPKDISSFVVKDVEESYPYEINGVRPSFSVYDGNKLIEVDNYSASYYRNKEISTPDNKAYISIKGNGNYSGTLRYEFAITQRIYNDDEIEIVFESDKYYYTGSNISPKYSIVINNEATTIASTISFYLDNLCENENSPLDAGIYYAKVVFSCAEYRGEKIVKFEILRVELSNSFITVDATATYNGNDITLTQNSLELKYNEMILALGTDFSLEYQNNKNAGQYNLVINGINNFTGTINTKYTINKAKLSLKASDLTGQYSEDIKELTYEIVSGEIYNDDIINVSLTTLATNSSDVGDYNIYIEASNNNYEMTLINGTYKITPYVIVISNLDQTTKYNNKLQLPTLPIKLPDEVSVTYYKDGKVFEGIKEQGEYSLVAKFTTTTNNYEVPSDISFTFKIELSKSIEIKADSQMDFIYISVEIKRGREYKYRRTYTEKGIIHGIDDVGENTYGINENYVILGQVLPQTKLADLVAGLNIDANNIRAYRYANNKYTLLYDCDETKLNSSKVKRYNVGTGWKLEYVIDGVVLDTVYISVIGDTNGDGSVTAKDYLDTKNYIQDNTTITRDDAILAIMIKNRGGSITSSDLLIIKNAISDISVLNSCLYTKPSTNNSTLDVVNNNETPTIDEKIVENNTSIAEETISEESIIDNEETIVVFDEAIEEEVVEVDSSSNTDSDTTIEDVNNYASVNDSVIYYENSKIEVQLSDLKKQKALILNKNFKEDYL